jgi:High potential iron-sulfur protein
MSNENNRRDFLKLGTLGLLGAVVAAKVGLPETAFAQAGQDAKPTDPNAAALGYVEDATKANVAKFPKYKTDKEKNAHCWNCMFYQSKDKEPSKSTKAPCQILMNKNVASKGWCNSWALKAGVK